MDRLRYMCPNTTSTQIFHGAYKRDREEEKRIQQLSRAAGLTKEHNQSSTSAHNRSTQLIIIMLTVQQMKAGMRNKHSGTNVSIPCCQFRQLVYKGAVEYFVCRTGCKIASCKMTLSYDNEQ